MIVVWTANTPLASSHDQRLTGHQPGHAKSWRSDIIKDGKQISLRKSNTSTVSL